MPKKHTSIEYYVLLQLELLKKRHTPFKLKPFIKSVQPFCKTSKLKDKILFVRFRGSKKGLKIEIQNDSYFVVTDSTQTYEFHLFCTSGKSLLQKLIYHKLLTP